MFTILCGITAFKSLGKYITKQEPVKSRYYVFCLGSQEYACVAVVRRMIIYEIIGDFMIIDKWFFRLTIS